MLEEPRLQRGGLLHITVLDEQVLRCGATRLEEHVPFLNGEMQQKRSLDDEGDCNEQYDNMTHFKRFIVGTLRGFVVSRLVYEYRERQNTLLVGVGVDSSSSGEK